MSNPNFSFDENKTAEDYSNLDASSLCGFYREVKAYFESETDEFVARMRPYKDEMEKILGGLGIKLDREGAKNFSTARGTAYFSTLKRFRVSDREAWLKWVKDHEAWDCLTSAVSKEGIQDHLDNFEVPKGLDMEEIRSVHVRKP